MPLIQGNFSSGNLNISGKISGLSNGTSASDAVNLAQLQSVNATAVSGNVGGSGTANRIAFWNASSTITSDGNLTWDDTNKRLGIGTTAPDARFEVVDNGYSQDTFARFTQDDQNTNGLVIGNDAYSTTRNYGMSFGIDNTGKAYIRGGGATTKDLILQDTGGNVGIGTAGPGGKLEVNGGSNDVDLIVRTTGAGQSARLKLQDANEYYYIYTNSGSSALRVHNGSADIFEISSTGNVQADGTLSIDGTGNSYINGNVGIGTTSPVKKLDVVGDINYTGNIYGNNSYAYYNITNWNNPYSYYNSTTLNSLTNLNISNNLTVGRNLSV